MKVYLTYLGFYDKSGDTIPLRNAHVYQIIRVEGGVKVPVGWRTNTVFARAGERITEEQVEYMIAREFKVDVTK